KSPQLIGRRSLEPPLPKSHRAAAFGGCTDDFIGALFMELRSSLRCGARSPARIVHGALDDLVAAGLARRPRLDTLAPQPHETLGVLMTEAVGGVVGGEAVVVEAHLAPASDDDAAVRFAAKPDLAAHEALAVVDEGVERLLERREPQAVVDQLRVAGLEARLLVGQVALEGDALEVLMGHDQRQRAGALVDL